ncbi:MAG: NAD(P)-binding protein [Burkholderiales bacterium]|nr:NAD(P)-binding protein [Burkholderiales bacterium]
MATFDGVIVGAGHNGPTLGAYMARARLRVCVLEAAGEIGGGCSTADATLPGFR